MTAVLAYIRTAAGGPKPYFTMTVRPDEVMGWQADIVVSLVHLSTVRSVLNEQGHQHTMSYDTPNAWPRIRASLGNGQTNILRYLRSLTPAMDRRLPEVSYHFAEPTAGETPEPDVVLVVDTAHNTVTVRQHQAEGSVPWSASVWERFAEALTSGEGFDHNLTGANACPNQAVLTFTTGGIVQILDYAPAIIENIPRPRP